MKTATRTPKKKPALKLTPQQKIEARKKELIDQMSITYVNCPDRKRSIWDLASTEGVDKRVVYYNDVEKLTHLLPPSPISVVVRKNHDYGLIFNGGLEIRHVESAHVNFFRDAELVEKRDRV